MLKISPIPRRVYLHLLLLEALGVNIYRILAFPKTQTLSFNAKYGHCRVNRSCNEGQGAPPSDHKLPYYNFVIFEDETNGQIFFRKVLVCFELNVYIFPRKLSVCRGSEGK